MQAENRHVKVTSDIQVKTSTKLKTIGAAHPFTFQVDVLFPSSDILETALRKLTTRYVKAQVKLADVVDSNGPFANIYSRPQGCFSMLATDPSDDVWCIDPRGLLTLLVTKTTYERLGLVGTALPFKAHKNYFVIRLPLQKNAESVANQARRNQALKAWDEKREQEGLGAWNVVYCFNDPLVPELLLPNSRVCEVESQVVKSNDVHIPSPSLTRRPPTGEDDEVEDWETETAALFEWIGLACLGSQRLNANDRVDPYVALYQHPSPSYVGNITRLRWSGSLLGSAFLQSVIDTSIFSEADDKRVCPPYDTFSETMNSMPVISEAVKPFVAITSHSRSGSPVTYIPPSATTIEGPTRLARADGEDTWSLFATINPHEPQSIDLAFAESLGQYDTRWG